MGSLEKLFHECSALFLSVVERMAKGKTYPVGPGKASGWVILIWMAGPVEVSLAPCGRGPGTCSEAQQEKPLWSLSCPVKNAD